MGITFQIYNTYVCPATNALLDLGESSKQFKNLYLDGLAYIDGFGEDTQFATDKKIYFRDTALGIYSQADTFLDIFADGGLRIGDSSAGAPTNYTKIAPDGSVSQAGTARIDWTKITANGVTILNSHGTPTGTVSNLQTAHDGSFYIVNEESGETPGLDFVVDFAGVTAFNWVQVLARYQQASAGHGITIMLEITPFNGTAWHRYDFMVDQAANLTNENHSFFVPNDAAYINSGVVKVRFVHEMIGTSSAHNVVVDVCALYQ